MNRASSRSKMNLITVFIFTIIGIGLLIGGIWLAAIGGSVYYIIAAILMLLTAFLLYKGRISALLVYAALVLGTVIWAIWEVGTDFWALAPRLDILGLLGLWLLIPAVTYNFINRKPAIMALGAVLALTILVMIYSIFNDPQEIHGELKAQQPAQGQALPGIPPEDWPAYGRTQSGLRYSPLAQINANNVKDLKVAWTYRTRDFKTDKDSGETTNQVTPIKVGNNMYICTTHQFLVALDPATGKEKWRFDPKLKTDPSFQHLTCRGVSYYDQNNTAEFATSLQGRTSTSAICPRKVILPVNDGRLVAINADNGQRCTDFGENGEVNLQLYMPNAYPGGYNPTSPPIVTGSTIIIAGSVTDNLSIKEPSGVIRGYDVNTGKLLWVFDTGAADPNAMPTTGGTYVHNSPNAWAPLAYDSQLDIVYIPTGVSTPDIWGGHRTPQMERYANAVVALNASTGKLVWSFQTTHHDLWDMDVPSQPTLVDVKAKNGQIVSAIYAPTKTGHIFVLDRRTGQPVVPVHEEPVPQGAAKGDWVSKTQPISEFTFRPKNHLTDKDMWGATMFDQLMCRVMFHSLDYKGPYTPPSENGTIVFPGNLGMFEWGGISVNPDRQVAVMNPMALPFVSKLIPRGPGNPIWPEGGVKGTGTESGIQPQYGVPYGVEINAFLSPLGLPCKQPAWGYIAGVDLDNHQIAWKKRVGTIRDSLPGIPLPPFKLGVPMLGGPISTAGNVMFLAGTQDNYIRAFNVSNGDELWKARLPAGGQATPMTYSINGKQYVVIMAGGHGSFGTKMGDYLIAYALPD